MKRWLPILTLITFACAVPSLTLETQTQQAPTPENTTPTATPSLSLLPTFTPTPQHAVTPIPLIFPDLNQDSISVDPSDLFPNDYYSIDVVPQIPSEMTEAMTLTVTFPDGTEKQKVLEPTGLDEEFRARFPWVNQVPDNTSPLSLTLTLVSPTSLHSNITQTLSVTTYISVLPVELLPPPEPDARWAMTRTAGFRLHYITGTKAERDLD